jgi:hypothetical protein
VADIAMIKVREVGATRWQFLSRDGTTKLRVHALRFPSYDKAQALIEENVADNPEWEWKTVPAVTR